MKCEIFYLLAFFAPQAMFAEFVGDKDNMLRLEDKLSSQKNEIFDMLTDPDMVSALGMGVSKGNKYVPCLSQDEIFKFDKTCQNAKDKCDACYDKQENVEIAEKCCDEAIKILKEEVKALEDKAIACGKNKENKNLDTDESEEKKN